MSIKPRRVGIFGGSFDPFTCGHMKAISQALVLPQKRTETFEDIHLCTSIQPSQCQNDNKKSEKDEKYSKNDRKELNNKERKSKNEEIESKNVEKESLNDESDDTKKDDSKKGYTDDYINENFFFDEIWVTPARSKGRKDKKNESSIKDRYNMCILAAEISFYHNYELYTQINSCSVSNLTTDSYNHINQIDENNHNNDDNNENNNEDNNENRDNDDNENNNHNNIGNSDNHHNNHENVKNNENNETNSREAKDSSIEDSVDVYTPSTIAPISQKHSLDTKNSDNRNINTNFNLYEGINNNGNENINDNHNNDLIQNHHNNDIIHNNYNNDIIHNNDEDIIDNVANNHKNPENNDYFDDSQTNICSSSCINCQKININMRRIINQYNDYTTHKPVRVIDFEMNFPEYLGCFQLHKILASIFPFEFFFIGGEDLLINLPKWRSAHKIRSDMNMLILPRPMYDNKKFVVPSFDEEIADSPWSPPGEEKIVVNSLVEKWKLPKISRNEKKDIYIRKGIFLHINHLTDSLAPSQTSISSSHVRWLVQSHLQDLNNNTKNYQNTENKDKNGQNNETNNHGNNDKNRHENNKNNKNIINNNIKTQFTTLLTRFSGILPPCILLYILKKSLYF